MIEPEKIVRVAAKGDGVTASGRHVALAAPGDVVLADGTVEPGPHRAVPPCRHFGRCGGCHLDLMNNEKSAIRSAASDEVLRHEECGRIMVRTAESGL